MVFLPPTPNHFRGDVRVEDGQMAPGQSADSAEELSGMKGSAEEEEEEEEEVMMVQRALLFSQRQDEILTQDLPVRPTAERPAP